MRKSKIDINELVRLYSVENLKIDDISEKLKISYSTIRRILAKNGFKGKVLNIKDQRYGKLVAVERLRENNKTFWLCKCDCGNSKKISLGNLRTGDTKSCGCIQKERCEARKDKPSITYLKILKKNAVKRKIDFNISVEDILNQFQKQKEKCYYTQTKLYFHANLTQYRDKQTASVDRKDSNKGYTKDNIIIVHKAINKMKSHFSHDEFINFCGLVIENHSFNKNKALVLLSKAKCKKHHSPSFGAL